jgi:hypothetical protein
VPIFQKRSEFSASIELIFLKTKEGKAMDMLHGNIM